MGRQLNLPNKITLSRIFMVPVFVFFIIPLPDWLISNIYVSFLSPQLNIMNDFIKAYGNYFAAVFFIIAASTDGVDGYIARKRKQVTRFGKFLDPIADKLLIAAALIALVQRHDVTGWAAMIIIGREFIVTAFRLVAAGEGIIIAADRWGKIKMILQTIAVAASLLKNYPLSLLTDFPFDDVSMMLAICATVYSGYNYVAKNIKVIDDAIT